MNHRLNIEYGKYAKITVHLRSCNICNSIEIEDEFHLICVCDKYDALRKVFFDDIAKAIINWLYNNSLRIVSCVVLVICYIYLLRSYLFWIHCRIDFESFESLCCGHNFCGDDCPDYL